MVKMRFFSALLCFQAMRCDVGEVKRWWSMSSRHLPSGATGEALVSFSAAGRSVRYIKYIHNPLTHIVSIKRAMAGMMLRSGPVALTAEQLESFKQVIANICPADGTNRLAHFQSYCELISPLKGVRSVMRQWTALELAVNHGWGGRSSAEKAGHLIEDVLALFEGPQRIYKDVSQ